MRLIDADALLEKYNVKDTNIAECLTDKKMARAFERFCIIADAVEEQPTVDAVPVVRCRDCLWRHDDSSPMWLPCMERETPNDWYCADGERRSDEQQ